MATDLGKLLAEMKRDGVNLSTPRTSVEQNDELTVEMNGGTLSITQGVLDKFKGNDRGLKAVIAVEMYKADIIDRATGDLEPRQLELQAQAKAAAVYGTATVAESVRNLDKPNPFAGGQGIPQGVELPKEMDVILGAGGAARATANAREQWKRMAKDYPAAAQEHSLNPSPGDLHKATEQERAHPQAAPAAQPKAAEPSRQEVGDYLANLAGEAAQAVIGAIKNASVRPVEVRYDREVSEIGVAQQYDPRTAQGTDLDKLTVSGGAVSNLNRDELRALMEVALAESIIHQNHGNAQIKGVPTINLNDGKHEQVKGLMAMISSDQQDAEKDKLAAVHLVGEMNGGREAANLKSALEKVKLERTGGFSPDPLTEASLSELKQLPVPAAAGQGAGKHK